jgi:phytoene dehydrogenase-like protein
VHDTFSAFYPLAAASRTIQSLRLEEHGLTWRHAPAVLGHPFVDGSWALLHRDRDVTARLADAQHPGDGEAWLELCAEWDTIGEPLVGALLTPFPPVRPALGLLARLRRVGGLRFVRTLLTPAAELGQRRFGGVGPSILLAGNAGHSDIPLDSPGSGLMGLLMTMLGQTVGFPVPEGGAGRLADALSHRLASRGGRLVCDAEVIGIDVDRGRVVGVRTATERVSARRAVIADVSAPHLFGRLLDPDDVPRRVARGMEQFEMDPGTVKVDWALGGPVPWLTEPAYAPGTVHVADSVEQMSVALSQVRSGAVPAAPFLLAGQMSTTDPTRSPAGTESFWAYTHVPQETREDAGEGSIRGVWDHDDCERFADRMQARIERLAPGFGSTIQARRVLGPRELEARNANLIGGAIGGGTAQLHQELVFRPVPGLGRAETGVAGLYLGSAAAHPGGGVHGAPGSNAARAALLHHRLRLGR